jgi:hypothetical protein
MSAESGYGKISTSGLTFGYDVGETKNSFKGKPTTNYVTNASTMANFGNYSCGTPVTFTTEFGTTGYRMTNLGSWNGVVMGGISLPSTGTYTFSAYIRYLGGSPNNNGGTVYTSGFGLNDTAAYHNKSVVGEWFRLTNTQNCTGTNGTFYLISYGGTYCDDYSSWEVTMPQIEAGSVATPWVDGSRSTTQSLIDITGTRTIDSSNISYSSGNVPSFDATDDYLTLGSDVDFKTSGGWTVESVVYYNSVAGGYNNTTSPANFIGSEDINYNSWYWSVLDNKLALWNISPGYWKYGSTTLQPNTWYHVVITCSDDGTRYQFYLNGAAEGGDHTTNVWNASYSGLRIRYIGKGNNANTRLVNGQIPITKVYNRVLSREEILRNSTHYSKRYGYTVKDGSTSALAAPSAQYLADLGIKANGVYWLQPSGQSAFQAPVRFYLGKAMVCVMKGGNESGYVPDSPYWENTTLDNENDFTLTNGVRSKYQSYNVVPFTEFYWTMGQLDYQTTFSLSSEVSSMYVAQTRSWNSSANRSSPHFGNSIDYRTLVGADRRYTSALGTEIYLMGMDLKHEGHYGGGGGSSGGRIRVGSILDESTGNTAGEAYGNAGSAFGIGVNGGNPLKTGVCGYAGWTEPSIIGGADNWSLWVVF